MSTDPGAPDGGRGRRPPRWALAAAGWLVAAALAGILVWGGGLNPGAVPPGDAVPPGNPVPPQGAVPPGDAVPPQGAAPPGDGNTPDPPTGGTTVDLLDAHYPPARAGQDGYHYHEVLQADLNGDGSAETVHVIARVERTGQPPPDDVAWDDGQPWQVYVEAPGGEVTPIYARWVQLGRLRVLLSEGEGVAPLIIQEEMGAGLALYQVTYRAPGRFENAELARVLILNRAQPVLPQP